MTSGPSLGRKRPRRAAIARGATAPQQYATALHKKQELSINFLCNPGDDGAHATDWLNSYYYSNFNYLLGTTVATRALPNRHHPYKSQLRDGRGYRKMHAEAKVIRKKSARSGWEYRLAPRAPGRGLS
jgi:hypothetical protein